MSNTQKPVMIIEAEVIEEYNKVEDLIDRAQNDIKHDIFKFFRDLKSGVYDNIPIEN